MDPIYHLRSPIYHPKPSFSFYHFFFPLIIFFLPTFFPLIIFFAPASSTVSGELLPTSPNPVGLLPPPRQLLSRGQPLKEHTRLSMGELMWPPDGGARTAAHWRSSCDGLQLTRSLPNTGLLNAGLRPTSLLPAVFVSRCRRHPVA